MSQELRSCEMEIPIFNPWNREILAMAKMRSSSNNV